METQFKSKDELIIDMINSMKCTLDYLIGMEKNFNESHEDEITNLRVLLKLYQKENLRLKQSTKKVAV